MSTKTPEDRYCSCVMHVAASYPKYNPYAVCTSTVYTKKGLRRKGRVECSKRLVFEEYTKKELEGYAKMKKIPNASRMTKDQLVEELNRYVAATEGQKVWQQYLKAYRKDHPRTSFANAAKKASTEYRREKRKLLQNR